MKRKSALFSLLLAAALMLAACGGASNNTDGAGLETPAPGQVGETPVLETPMVETPAGEVAATPTLVVEDVEPTGTVVAVEPTETVAAAEPGLTGTPQADVPVTGDGAVPQCVPNRLTSVLEAQLVDDAGLVIGDVDAVVVYRDAAGAQLEDGATGEEMDDGAAQTTPAAGETPAADGAGDAPAFDPATMAAPTIGYVIVDLDDAQELGDKDVLLPFTGLQVADASLMEATPGAGTPMATPDQDVAGTPDSGLAGDANQGVAQAGQLIDGCAFTLTAGAEALAGAPNLDDNAWEELDLDAPDWDADFRTYWTNAGVTLADVDAETGAQLGNPDLFTERFDDIDVENPQGEDLGEVEDFIFDQQTGRFQYAVLATGGFLGLGERHIPVPLNQIVWVDLDDDLDDLGEMVINVDAETLENAPAIENLDELDTTVDGWDADFESYWLDVTPATP